jgi:hypothetical protein
MGKRELLLVGAFVLVGVVMYQLTAAPAPSGTRTVSVGRFIDHLRREIRGNRSFAEVSSTTTHPIDPATTEVRLRLGMTARLTVTGEDRKDVEINLKVRSNGYDDAEAQRLAKQSVDALRIDNAGAALIATVTYPDPGSQWPTAVIKVPSTLRVRVEQASALTVSDLQTVELGPTRGETTIRNVADLVTGTHRGGKVTIEHAGTVKLSTRGSQVIVTDVKDLTLSMTAGGGLTASNIRGAIEIDGNQTDLKLLMLDKTKGPIRVNAVGGTLILDGLAAEARIDGRQTSIAVTMHQAVPLAIYNEGDEDVALTPPATGFKLDAVARDGRILPADVLQQLGVTHEPGDEGKEARASGAVRGGGPTITVRTNRGNLVLKPRQLPTSQSPTTK